MKITYYIRLAVVMCIGLMTVSCKGFLKEHSEDLAYIRTLDDLDQLLIGSAYMTVHPRTPLNYKNFYIPFVHYMADETEEVIGNTRYNPEANIRPRIFGYYTWQKNVGAYFDTSKHADESTDWLRFYNHISTLNTVLSELKNIAPKSSKEIDRHNLIKAEALSLRSIYYFLLVNLYASPYSEANRSVPGVPLKLSSHVEDRKFTRRTIGEVYDHIVQDLEEAAHLIAGQPVRSKYRFSEAGICLMLSRVYLYMQNWKMAKTYAQKSLALHATLENYNGWDKAISVQRIESPEVLFSMGGSLLYGHLNSSSPTGGFQVSAGLYDLFDQGDLRKDLFFKKQKEKGSITGNVIFPIKQDPKGTNRGQVSDIFCLRTAEAYLNMAEASAMLGEISEAQDNLNKLLSARIDRSIFKPLEGLSQEELVKAVRTERRKELCFEGHRWFDLRRYRVTTLLPEKTELTNTYTVYSKDGRNSKMSVTYYYTLPAEEDAGYVLPIPAEQKAINDTIKDNIRVERTPSKTKTYE